MLRGVWSVERFDRAVAIFLALTLIALGIATLVSAPLSFDGAFFLFRVLDTHQFGIVRDRGTHKRAGVGGAKIFARSTQLVRRTHSGPGRSSDRLRHNRKI